MEDNTNKKRLLRSPLAAETITQVMNNECICTKIRNTDKTKKKRHNKIHLRILSKITHVNTVDKTGRRKFLRIPSVPID